MVSAVHSYDSVLKGVYVRFKFLEDRNIYQYVFDNTEGNTIDHAVKVINRLLEDNLTLCAVFPRFPEKNFKEQIQNNRYLTINEAAVCLSEEPKCWDAPLEYQDLYFSRALLKEPVRCSKHHLLEKKYVEFWKKQRGDLCPKGNHPLGSIEIDNEIKERLDQYRKEKKPDDDSIAECKREMAEDSQVADGNIVNHISTPPKQSHTSTPHSTIPNRQGSIQEAQNDSSIKLGGTVVKISILLGSEQAIQSLSKLVVKVGAEKVPVFAAKLLSKEAAENIVKNIPFLGFGVRAMIMGYRLYKGETKRALGELAAGLVSLAPGVGTAAAFAMDTGLTGCDIYEMRNIYSKQNSGQASNQSEMQPEQTPTQEEIANALKELGLKEDSKLKKEDVDGAYRKQSKGTHPDKTSNLGEDSTSNFDGYMVKINAARDTLYRAYQWKKD